MYGSWLRICAYVSKCLAEPTTNMLHCVFCIILQQSFAETAAAMGTTIPLRKHATQKEYKLNTMQRDCY